MNDHAVDFLEGRINIDTDISLEIEYVDNVHRNFNIIKEEFGNDDDFKECIEHLYTTIIFLDMSKREYSHMTFLLSMENNYTIENISLFLDDMINNNGIFDSLIHLMRNDLRDFSDDIQKYKTLRYSIEKDISFSKEISNCVVCYNEMKCINIEERKSSCSICSSTCCSNCFNRILKNTLYKCPSCRYIHKIQIKYI